MNILFLFCYLPQLNSKGDLYAQLVNEFHEQGHTVCVSAKGKDIDKTHLQKENGIEVLRIKSHDFTGVSSNVKKALAYQEYALKQRYYTKKYFKHTKFDLIVSHSLPPELAYIVGGLKTYYKCPFYLIQSDFIWQDAVAFGYFSANNPIALYYRFWEKKMFKKADYIGCPTKGNVSFIKKYYPDIPDDRFDILPFWLNEVKVEPNYQLKEVFGLKDKFVVIYGGSIGAAQRIEHIIELADACKEYKDIVFVILGKGAYLDVIKDMVAERQLENVVFKAFLPQEQYLSFLAACDVGLIILNEKMATPNFPSKALSYLNMRVPILAALDHTTDFGSYLEENNAGLWGYSDDIPTLKGKLISYYENKELREQVKENGYKLFKNHLTTHQAYQTIINKVTNG